MNSIPIPVGLFRATFRQCHVTAVSHALANATANAMANANANANVNALALAMIVGKVRRFGKVYIAPVALIGNQAVFLPKNKFFNSDRESAKI